MLDVGGAFGVYATWLAERGHRVRPGGVAHWMPDIAGRLSDPDDRALVLVLVLVLEILARTEREPTTLGATAHVLVAAHR